METQEAQLLYPVFEPNQILSSTHLNNLRRYLDRENRLSRVRLSGVGIVSGLQFRKIESEGSLTGIEITLGYGVTSDGYLIDVGTIDGRGEMPGNREVCKPGTILPFGYQRRYVQDTTNDDPYYFSKNAVHGDTHPLPLPCTDEVVEEIVAGKKVEVLKKEPPVQPQCYELCQTDTGKGFKPLSELDIDQNDFALVLFCEAIDKDLRSCTGSNCDNKGKQREFNIRVLLVEKSWLELHEPEKYVGLKNSPRFRNLRRIRGARPGLNPLAQVHSLNELRNLYIPIITEQVAELRDAIHQTFFDCGWLMGLTEENLFEALDTLDSIDDPGSVANMHYIQYAWDLLSDLTMTWNEFTEASLDWLETGGALPDTFAQHLTLGELIPSGGIYDRYRNSFLNTRPVDAQDRKLLRLQMLWQKMLSMINFFHVPDDIADVMETRITPGKAEPLPLSERSLPFYYHPTRLKNELVRLWNPLRTLRGQESDLMGYYAKFYAAGEGTSSDETSKKYIIDPLNYSINDLPFLRIEGIAGKPYPQVLKELEAMKKQYNLGFGVIALKLEKDGLIRELPWDCCDHDLQEEYVLHREEIIRTLDKLVNYFAAMIEQSTVDLNEKEKEDLARLLQILVGQRDKAVDCLPPCLADFDYPTFKRNYKAFIDMTVTWLLRQVNAASADELAKLDSEENYTIFNVLRDGIADMIYGLLNNMSHHRIYKSWYKLRLREERRNRAMQFAIFADHHPGMEHLAGTYKNGTFIIVYEGDTHQSIGLPEKEEPRFEIIKVLPNYFDTVKEVKPLDIKTDIKAAVDAKDAILTDADVKAAAAANITLGEMTDLKSMYTRLKATFEEPKVPEPVSPVDALKTLYLRLYDINSTYLKSAIYESQLGQLKEAIQGIYTIYQNDPNNEKLSAIISATMLEIERLGAKMQNELGDAGAVKVANEYVVAPAKDTIVAANYEKTIAAAPAAETFTVANYEKTVAAAPANETVTPISYEKTIVAAPAKDTIVVNDPKVSNITVANTGYTVKYTTDTSIKVTDNQVIAAYDTLRLYKI